MKRFVLTPEARGDLQDIWEFVAGHLCAVAIGLAAASALASYLPSRRAAVDPIEALRAE